MLTDAPTPFLGTPLVPRKEGLVQAALPKEPSRAAPQRLGRDYLSNAASFVFYGIACLVRLIEFAAFFVAFEEHMH